MHELNTGRRWTLVETRWMDALRIASDASTVLIAWMLTIVLVLVANTSMNARKLMVERDERSKAMTQEFVNSLGDGDYDDLDALRMKLQDAVRQVNSEM